MDAAYLYGGHFFRGCADFLPTGVYGAWTGKNQPAACVFKKTDFADTADFYSAVFFYKQGMGRVIAEPVSDIIAACVTGTMFFLRLNKILGKKERGLE